MEQGALYFTNKMIEEYLRTNFPEDKPQIDMREALLRMRDDGLLMTDGTPKHIPGRGLDFETFYRYMSELPYDASAFLRITDEDFWKKSATEEAAFRPGQSVMCCKLISRIARRPVSREYFEFYYVSRGSAELCFEEESYPLQAGDLCILPPASPHVINFDQDSFVLDVFIRASNFDSRFGEMMTMSGVFSGFFREALYGSTPQPNFLLMHTKAGDSLVDMCLRGAGLESVIPDRHSEISSSSWVKLLLCYALRSCGERVEIYRFPTGGNPRADCGEILQYIQQNYRTVRLSSLARQFHYNETYLSRMLQNYARQSFTEIVRDIRMNRAVEYLTNSSLRVHEIAGLVGYSSVDHFSRAFKATYGVSPQGYRRENRK